MKFIEIINWVTIERKLMLSETLRTKRQLPRTMALVSLPKVENLHR